MARGKYLSLEEARKSGRIGQFCAEHPSRGKWKDFDALMDAFCGPGAKSSSRAVRTSSRGRDVGKPPKRSKAAEGKK